MLSFSKQGTEKVEGKVIYHRNSEKSFYLQNLGVFIKLQNKYKSNSRCSEPW